MDVGPAHLPVQRKETAVRRKLLVLVPVVFALLALGLCSPAAATSDGAGQAQCEVTLPDTTDSALDYPAITTVIADYFTCYYRSLEQLAVEPDLSSYIADTEETHLYLRMLQYGIDWRKEWGPSVSGIADGKLESIDIKYARQRDAGQIEVRAYVVAGFRYVADESRTRNRAGDLWEIELDTVDGVLKIVSLNSEANDYGWAKRLVAENLEKRDVASYTKKNAADDAYVEMCAWMMQSHKDGLAAQASPVEEGTAQTSSTLSAQSVGVSYNASQAALFGCLGGNTHDPGIFLPDKTGVAPYYHSVMVVSSSTTLGNPANTYVGQHSGDNGWRQLLECINTNGCNYVRMLRMFTGSFNS